MTKIIIQPGKYRGLYQIVLLQCKRFLLIKRWKPIIISEYHEEEAVSKLCELIKKYQIKPCAVYNWSGDESYREIIQKTIKKLFLILLIQKTAKRFLTVPNETAAYSCNENRRAHAKVLRKEK
jgi:hypothetical protein